MFKGHLRILVCFKWGILSCRTVREAVSDTNVSLLSFVLFSYNKMCQMNGGELLTKKSRSVAISEMSLIASCVVFLSDYVTVKWLINRMQFVLLWSIHKPLKCRGSISWEGKQTRGIKHLLSSAACRNKKPEVKWWHVTLFLQKDEQIWRGSFLSCP